MTRCARHNDDAGQSALIHPRVKERIGTAADGKVGRDQPFDKRHRHELRQMAEHGLDNEPSVATEDSPGPTSSDSSRKSWRCLRDKPSFANDGFPRPGPAVWEPAQGAPYPGRPRRTLTGGLGGSTMYGFAATRGRPPRGPCLRRSATPWRSGWWA